MIFPTKMRRAEVIGNTIAVIVIGIIIVLFVSFIKFINDQEDDFNRRNQLVASMTDVGVVQTVDFLEDGESVVRTDKGDFCVYGKFQTVRGKTVVLEVRETGRTYLCLYESDYCKRLAE